MPKVTDTFAKAAFSRSTASCVLRVGWGAIGPVAPLAVPMSLHASLLARLDRLAPTREVAQIGAALGRRFSHGLISAIAVMPQQQLDDALAELVRAELIFRRGKWPSASSSIGAARP